MLTCQICKRDFKSLRFKTVDIAICTRCVNTLNNKPEPASQAHARWAEKLANGMRRNAESDLQDAEEWKRSKAQRTLRDLDGAVDAALHGWLTRLLKKPGNTTRDFKIVRAARRGLLRMDGHADYGPEWPSVASRIRARDGKCGSCGRADASLDVHHIVYLSHHGTNQKHNLVALCRPCHEAEHGRVFDWLEARDPEPTHPIQPPVGTTPPAHLPAAPLSPQQPSIPAAPSLPPRTFYGGELPAHGAMLDEPPPRVDVQCQGCRVLLTVPAHHAVPGRIIRCPKCQQIFAYGATQATSKPSVSPVAAPPKLANTPPPVMPDHHPARRAGAIAAIGVLLILALYVVIFFAQR